MRIIGSGSFGVVYHARLLETNDSVAIKKVLQDKRFKVRGEKSEGWIGGEGVEGGRVCGEACVRREGVW